MTQTTITAQLRDRAGKGTARATRRAGNVPAVIYGGKKDPVLIALNTKEIEALSRKAGFTTKLMEVKVGKDSYQVLARDSQRHPVSEQLEHVDFMRVDPKTRIRVAVPVKFVNSDKSPGIKRGGVLNIVMHSIELWAAATNIPAAIAMDLTGLEINDGLHSASIKLPEGAKLVHEGEDFTIATIAAPSAIRSELKEKAQAAAAAAAAPAAEAAPAAAAAPAAGAAAPAAGAKAPAAPAKK
jgi:large subunit ribosomal protein L25